MEEEIKVFCTSCNRELALDDAVPISREELEKAEGPIGVHASCPFCFKIALIIRQREVVKLKENLGRQT